MLYGDRRAKKKPDPLVLIPRAQYLTASTWEISYQQKQR